MNLIDWLCFLVITGKFCFGQSEIGNVIIEAYKPSGIQVKIPAVPELRVFGFHANINHEIDSTEPGEINGDVTVDSAESSDTIAYVNPNVKLEVGETIHYWIHVQVKNLGYRSQGTWKVEELKKSPLEPCDPGISRIDRRNNVCKDTVIFQDDFKTNSINENSWVIEQYMPHAPDFEFVIYKKDKDVVFSKNDALTIKPKYITDEAEVRKDILDLSNGCTRKIDRECRNTRFLLQNPVISGRVVSNISFQYGDIEIRAKLPSGDWIYPQIYLEGENNQKIVIAYARGNEHLTGNENVDIGGSLLFAGPVLSFKEPQRSSKLSSLREETPFSAGFHVYRLKWTKGKMEFFVDNKRFGEVSSDAIQGSSLSGNNVKLVIGVGVGGVTDFPDDYKSGNVLKPWRNFERQQVLNFHKSRNDWLNTWDENSLEIDYVKIKSV